MDILQLYYLVNIVECNFNLSLAAKKIHISQPALSQFISTFEKENDIDLFYRKNSRLQSLTEAGEKVYEYALKILGMSDELNEVIQYQSLRQKGTIRIGIPSLILESFFASYFPKLAIESPDMKISITEDGSHALRKRLIKEDLDIGILIEPTMLDEDKYEQHIISIDEMVAFIRKDHPLATKEKLAWKDIESYPLATFNSSFMTYQLINDKLMENALDKQVLFTASSWAYLISATYETDIVTILPRPVESKLDPEFATVRHFEQPIPFDFTICRLRKSKYEPVKNFIYNQIIENFYKPVEE